MKVNIKKQKKEEVLEGKQMERKISEISENYNKK